MCHDYAKFSTAVLDLRLEVLARILDVVDVVHRESAWLGCLVLSLAVGEGRMWGQDREQFLLVAFQGFELFAAHFAAFHLLECSFYVSADSDCLRAFHGGIEGFQSAGRHI